MKTQISENSVERA